MERHRPPVGVPAQHQQRDFPPFSEGSSDVCAGFSSEAELLTHLKSTYDSTVSGGQSGLLAAAQHLLSAVKTFFSAEPDVLVRRASLGPGVVWFRMTSPVSSLQVRVAGFTQQHLLKSSRSIRQMTASAAAADRKVRE